MAKTKQERVNEDLLEAISAGIYEEYLDAIKKGADIHIQDKDDGSLPLLEAIHQHADQIVQDLIARGQDVNHKSEGGWTALHEAARGSNATAIRLLFAAGADPLPIDDEGKTPLDYLAPDKDSYTEMLEALGPSVAERDRRLLAATTVSPPGTQVTDGKCERCGRAAHTGRCRL